MGNTASFSTESLIAAYGSGISAYRLAKDAGCSIWSIITRLRKAGVEIRPDGTPKSISFTPEQRRVFDSLNAGLLLGDASINGNLVMKRNRCFLRMEQSNIRFGWLEQVRGLYAGLGVHANVIPVKPKARRAEIDGREIKGGSSSLLYTGVSDEFRELRRKWYPEEGKKRVPRDIGFDPLAVSMWFCGDGSSNGEIRGQLGFHTNGFIRPDVDFLIEGLEKEIGSSFRPSKSHREGQWTIFTNGRDSAVRLRDFVLPYMPKCCLYKLKHVREPKVSSWPITSRKLSTEAVESLRSKRASGASYSELAREFEVSVSCVAGIVTGRTYVS